MLNGEADRRESCSGDWCVSGSGSMMDFSISLTWREDFLDIKLDYSKSCGWTFMKFWGEVGLPIRNVHLDFSTNLDPDPDPGSVFPLFHHWEIGRFKHLVRYELKDLRLNAYNIFGWAGSRITNGVGGGLNSMSAFYSRLCYRRTDVSLSLHCIRRMLTAVRETFPYHWAV